MVGAVRMDLSPEFRRPYADSEATNRAVLLHRLSDATGFYFHRGLPGSVEVVAEGALL
jgi:hypothetical protein